MGARRSRAFETGPWRPPSKPRAGALRMTTPDPCILQGGEDYVNDTLLTTLQYFGAGAALLAAAVVSLNLGARVRRDGHVRAVRHLDRWR